MLMGAYVSEGCIGKRLTDGSASVVRISQKSKGRMEWVMDDYQKNHQETTRNFEFLHEDRSPPCLERIWTIADRTLAKQLEVECGHLAGNKRLPFWTRKLSRRQVNLLLKVMTDGDGTNRPYSDVYYTSSKQLADDIQAVCVSAGIVSQVWGPYQYAEETPMYQVYLGQSDPFATVVLKKEGSQNFRLENVENARVVCFTVPNEILVTRRNGKVAIHGNTKHGMHLVRLMKMCREIVSTGKVIVKRPDAAELLEIRAGSWSYEKLIEWSDKQEEELKALYETCKVIPHQPDREKIDKLCVEIVSEFLGLKKTANRKKSSK
jgi:hypothetical protein